MRLPIRLELTFSRVALGIKGESLVELLVL